MLQRKIPKKQQMIEYLCQHERYWTASSWNQLTTYSRCVKLNILPFPDAVTRNRAYEFLSIRESYEEGRAIIAAFEEYWQYNWTIKSNGRSAGYLILLKSDISDWGESVLSSENVGSSQVEEFHYWSMSQIKELYDVVRDFDRTVDRIIGAFVDYVSTHRIVQELIMVPKVVSISELE